MSWAQPPSSTMIPYGIGGPSMAPSPGVPSYGGAPTPGTMIPYGGASGSAASVAQSNVMQALLAALSGGGAGSMTRNGSNWQVTPTADQAARGITNPKPNTVPGYDWMGDANGYRAIPKIPQGYAPYTGINQGHLKPIDYMVPDPIDPTKMVSRKVVPWGPPQMQYGPNSFLRR